MNNIQGARTEFISIKGSGGTMQLIDSLSRKTDTKIVLVILDGLGGFPGPDGRSEMEVAHLPTLDRMAQEGSLGLATPVRVGVTPGSGPGHLGLFGYDPIDNLVGRGVLDILGTEVELQPGDVAARLNFCSMDANGLITDRRAGRIPSEEGIRLAQKINDALQFADVKARVHAVREHRASLVLRGDALFGAVTDTDPQQVGVMCKEARALDARSQRVADIINDFCSQAARILQDETTANMITVRGVDRYDKLPSLQSRFKLNAACIAIYPMYRGVSRLLGMDVLDAGMCWDQEVGTLERVWERYDYFFIHFKTTDSRGEDGDFAAKVAALEEVDKELDRILELKPNVIAICGDHSTPSVMAAHSWHPVPLLLHGPLVFADSSECFSEREAQRGGLGHLLAQDLMALLLAHALKLEKYGA